MSRETAMGRGLDNDRKWRKDNLRQFVLRLNRTKEQDVIGHLETKENLRRYLINLIRKDMNGNLLSETAKDR